MCRSTENVIANFDHRLAALATIARGQRVNNVGARQVRGQWQAPGWLAWLFGLGGVFRSQLFLAFFHFGCNGCCIRAEMFLE
jgi:hypothetical protein